MVSGVNGGLLVNIKVEKWVSLEWVSLEWVRGGVLSVVIHLLSLITHHSLLISRSCGDRLLRDEDFGGIKADF